MEPYMLPGQKPAVLLWQMRLISAKNHGVGELEVAGCKLELADAAGVDAHAHAQQGHAPRQPALW